MGQKKEMMLFDKKIYDHLLQYGDVLNILQADETDRVVERKEVPFEEYINRATEV